MGQPSRRVLNASPATLENARLRNLPPQNLDAEQAVLGGVLLKMCLRDKLGVELRPMDFYSPAHRMIWEAMLDLWRASKPVDLITLAAARPPPAASMPCSKTVSTPMGSRRRSFSTRTLPVKGMRSPHPQKGRPGTFFSFAG